MKILILGAEGALGTALQKQLYDHEVVAWDRDACDITEEDQVDDVLFDSEPDVVINAAAYTNVKEAETQPYLAWNVNADGARIVAEKCACYSRWLVHISTDYVFGGLQLAYYETSATNPIQNYGRTKLVGELAIQTILDPSMYTIVRTSTLYGPPRRPSFVRTIVRNAMMNDEIQVVENQASSPTSTDLLANLVNKFVVGENLKGIVHATGQGHCTKFEFAKRIVELLRIDCNVVSKKPDPDEQPQRPSRSVLNNGVLKSASRDWHDLPAWEDDLLAHFHKHSNEWREYIEQCKSELL